MKDLKEQLSNRNKQESSDLQSAQMVKQAIQDDQGLTEVAKGIQVTVKDGTVTLKGEVTTEQELNLATNTAGAIAVDEKVKNHMIISPKMLH